MPPATPSSDSIEDFATLSARLDDPFADRQAVLRAAGLDSDRWGLLVERWSARLGTAEGEALAERFGEAYAAVRRTHIELVPEAAPEPTAPRFLSPAAQPWRTEAAAVGIQTSSAPPPLAAAEAAPWPSPAVLGPQAPASEPRGTTSLAGTTDVNWRDLRAALPFGPTPPGGVHLPPAAPARPPLLGDLGGTLPVGVRLPAPVLPFDGSDAPPTEPRSRK